MASKFVHVLLVDPEQHAADLLGDAFLQRWPHCRLTVTGDAAEAMALLRAGNAGKSVPPQLILLSLSNRLAGDGLLFLQELRQDPALRRRPVFVLGHSSKEEDILAVYDYAPAGYVLWATVAGEPQRLLDLLDVYFSTVEFCDA